MTVSSTMWSVLIAIGALLVAYGNINYNVARDRERGQQAGEKAVAMIKAECSNNLARIAEMRKAFADNKVVTDKLEMTAWEIVSSGGLLVQVDQTSLAKIAEIYYLVGSANSYHAHLLELMSGIAIALQNAGELQKRQIDAIKLDLDKLEPKLTALLQ